MKTHDSKFHEHDLQVSLCNNISIYKVKHINIC